jgi:hypothetical protein
MKKNGNVFLKSINIIDDIGHPQRFAHYHPTTRSAPLISAVMKPGATMAIASYGSGKSLAAGIGALAVENDGSSASVLGEIARRLDPVVPAIAAALSERVASGARGRVVALSGYVKDLPEQIASALGLKPLRTVKAVVNAIRENGDFDHVAIVWDEFGRHLEGLVMDARSRDLEAVQDLAELAERPFGTTLSVTLLLHQSILAYARTLNQTSRNEWRKIEGRFEQMRFVEDSSQLYALIAKIVSARSPDDAPAMTVPLEDVASRAIEGRWFDDLTSADSVRMLVTKAWPLSAAALQVLPRLVARVGQNERSLFTFLESLDLRSVTGTDAVYEAFSEAIRSDIGVGGLHRQWVEVESARSKADTEAEREALSAAFLLQAGSSGERRRVRKSVLVGAVASAGIALDEATAAVDALVARKLLIHRKLNDEISVWHGADLDVSTKLREEREKIAPAFDVMAFLAKEHRAPFVRPVRHNVSRGVNRYLDGAFARASDLGKFLAQPHASDWGRIVYVLANTAEEISSVRTLAAEPWDRTILVVPSEAVPMEDAALEVEALLSLRHNEDLLSQDPLVAREIDELLAVARNHLSVILHRLTTDRPSASEWWHAGERLAVDADRPAGVAVSGILDGWYPRTPHVVNDQIVRTKLSRPMTTARVRMITRLMGHADTPRLAYAEDEGAAEASIYRTVLMRTGIHVERDGKGAFADPSEIADPGLSEVWGIVRDFFTARGRKKLSDLTRVLSAPPYGVAAGLMPILVMAGYKAFARAVAVRTEGAYVRDLLGFDSARMFLDPDATEFEVYSGAPQVLRYLDDFTNLFIYEKPGDMDEKVMVAAMALDKWISTLSDGARRSRRMSDEARTMLRLVQAADDPAELIMETLPKSLAPKDKGYAAGLTYVLDALKRCRDSVDSLVEGYLREAVEVVGEVLRLDGHRGDMMSGIRSWVACFDVEGLAKRQDLTITDATVLRTAAQAADGRYSAEGLARVVSQIMTKRGIDKWQDDTKEHFRKALREAKARIEAAALDVENPSESMAPVIESRIKYLEAQLLRIRRPSKN